LKGESALSWNDFETSQRIAVTIPDYVAIGILLLLALLALPRVLAGRLSEQIDPTRDQKAQQPQPNCEC
jgi:hypothetical protein